MIKTNRPFDQELRTSDVFRVLSWVDHAVVTTIIKAGSIEQAKALALRLFGPNLIQIEGCSTALVTVDKVHNAA